jgi:hypothetical protein
MYIVIDGDDSGRKITACYINNDEPRLRQISADLQSASLSISDLLSGHGFQIVFCAADGVAAATSRIDVKWDELFRSVREIAPHGFTFSAGVGDDLQEAYIALLNAKCLGKDRLEQFGDIAR